MSIKSFLETMLQYPPSDTTPDGMPTLIAERRVLDRMDIGGGKEAVQIRLDDGRIVWVEVFSFRQERAS
jgi:hypothetical protein